MTTKMLLRNKRILESVSGLLLHSSRLTRTANKIVFLMNDVAYLFMFTIHLKKFHFNSTSIQFDYVALEVVPGFVDVDAIMC